MSLRGVDQYESALSRVLDRTCQGQKHGPVVRAEWGEQCPGIGSYVICNCEA